MVAAITQTAVACCFWAVLISCSVPAVSGAWPWEVGLLKNRTSTTAAPASSSPKPTTDPPSTTTPMPPTTEPTPRLRSRPKSHSKKHHHLHTSTTPKPETEDKVVNTTTTTEAPAPSVPPTAAQPEPQHFSFVPPQLPAAPPPEMSPIVIVEPDYYPDTGRPYRSMYEQPYSGMYPPPMPYYPPPPPPTLPPYPSPYDPYSPVAYSSYQWPPLEPSYPRPYRSYPFAPFPTLGSYRNDYSPYPLWKPPVGGRGVGVDGPVGPAIQGGCSSEPKRDREELGPALMDAPADKKVEEPSPTHISLLPSYTPNVGSLDTTNYSSSDDGNVPMQSPYAGEENVEQSNTGTGNNGYAMVETAGRENHILRNNPYQPAPPAPYWPGYYEQSQWPQFNQWQQWPGAQQPQYPYGVGPQQPSVVPSQKGQAPGYGWAGRQNA